MKVSRILAAALMLVAVTVRGQVTLTLDSCRVMAVRSNKQMLIAGQKVDKAQWQRDQARAAYLPALDLQAMYLYNQKEISLFDSDQLLPTKTFDSSTGTYQYNLVADPTTGMPVTTSSGSYIPSTVAVMPKEALTYNIHNVFAGAVTLTQPVYMGGKIRAMNKLTGYAHEAARALHDLQAEQTIVDVDATYWQVVSLRAKERLAASYVALLDTLLYDVDCMLREGVATRADMLTVEVKRNSAEVDLVKVCDGLALSRMALNRLIGLPIDTPNRLADEDTAAPMDLLPLAADSLALNDVYAARLDVQALEWAVKAKGAEADVARSSMLPTLAAVGAYSWNTPSSYDGFKNRIGGMFSVGAVLKVPVWHWGGDMAKYKAARAEQVIARLELDDAREKVALQVRQCQFRCQESLVTLRMTESNIAKADENLRVADLGYREGVIPLSIVLEAQTAWLKACSENIDAQVDARLCNVYLLKALGRLTL